MLPSLPQYVARFGLVCGFLFFGVTESIGFTLAKIENSHVYIDLSQNFCLFNIVAIALWCAATAANWWHCAHQLKPLRNIFTETNFPTALESGWVGRETRRWILRPFTDIPTVRRVLDNAVALESTSAMQKHLHLEYWLNTGDIELRALRECQLKISSVQATSALKYAEACFCALGKLIDQYRMDSSDPDGYGLGCIFAVRSALVEEYHEPSSTRV